MDFLENDKKTPENDKNLGWIGVATTVFRGILRVILLESIAGATVRPEVQVLGPRTWSKASRSPCSPLAPDQRSTITPLAAKTPAG